VFIAWEYWPLLIKYTPKNRNAPSIQSTEGSSNNIEFFHISTVAMLRVVREIEKRVDKSRRVMRLHNLRIEMIPMQDSWESIKTRANKIALAIPGSLPDSIAEFEITLQITYDLYNGNIIKEHDYDNNYGVSMQNLATMSPNLNQQPFIAPSTAIDPRL